MPNHKVNMLDKKHPFNLSISKKVIIAFDSKCKKLDINKNDIAESLFKEFLK